MNTDIANMKVGLGEKKQKQAALQQEAKVLCRQISPLLNPLLLSIENMDIAKASVKMDQLVMAQAGLLKLQMQIEELEDALG
ncbi:hypothetical protein JYT85_01355 [Desulfocapsa sp. AH-315-G09]|nr:hypothetical protein [Desulfocapsa sp.]MBN4065274.1 hypothetical protein [Desulfocapsa sp. AH-315-G09]